ncbi:Myc-type, basic helix-loop-helix domain-containing protein, partial [Thamnocephalis sphaerospora]
AKKELLTEEQKRVNHIRSEQKRRDAIRHGFQDLSEIVPALHGVRVSKSVMLEEAAAWIAQLETECCQLQNEINMLDTKL